MVESGEWRWEWSGRGGDGDRETRYLLGWSCEMEWNGRSKDEMKMLQNVFVAVAVARYLDSTNHIWH